MKFKKCLLVCLIFQTLLIFSEAGGNLTPSPRLSPGTRAISPSRINSGRVRPSETNGRSPASSITNTAPVRPGPPGASGWPRPYTPQAPGSPRLPTPQAPVWPRPHTPQASGWTRPQTPGSSVSQPQSPTNNFFPGLTAPKQTYAEAEEKRRLEILKSSSSSSISSTGSGYYSGSGRSSFSSLGSFSSGYSSSGSLHQPIGLETHKSTAIQRSIASAQACVDKNTMPMVIAPAENCFDYFKLAVFWSPGYAYKQRKSGKYIRSDKVRPAWVIHGLWPSMFNRRENPISTCPRTDIYYRRDRFITNKILGVLDNTWYTILDKEYSDNTKFWEHEFKDHGSCASRSSVIGDDVKYFEKTLELFHQLNIGITLFNANYKVGTTTKLRNIVDVIQNRIDATIDADYVSNSITYENYVTELYICYDTNLRVMDCPNVKLTNSLLEKEVKLLESLPIA